MVPIFFHQVDLSALFTTRQQPVPNSEQVAKTVYCCKMLFLFGIWGKFEFFFSFVPHYCNDSLLRLDLNLGEINIG